MQGLDGLAVVVEALVRVHDDSDGELLRAGFDEVEGLVEVLDRVEGDPPKRFRQVGRRVGHRASLLLVGASGDEGGG